MKYLKRFNESLEAREELIKSVHDNVNWDLVEDIKDKAIDYLDQGKSLRILIGRPTETLCIIHHSNTSDSVNYQYGVSTSHGPTRLVTEEDRIFYTLSILDNVGHQNTRYIKRIEGTLEFSDEIKRMVKIAYPEEENNVGH